MTDIQKAALQNSTLDAAEEEKIVKNMAFQNPLLGSRAVRKELEKQDIRITTNKIQSIWQRCGLGNALNRVKALKQYADRNPNAELTDIQRVALQHFIKDLKNKSLIVQDNNFEDSWELIPGSSSPTTSRRASSANLTESQKSLSSSSSPAQSQGSDNSQGLENSIGESFSRDSIQPIFFGNKK